MFKSSIKTTYIAHAERLNVLIDQYEYTYLFAIIMKNIQF